MPVIYCLKRDVVLLNGKSGRRAVPLCQYNWTIELSWCAGLQPLILYCVEGSNVFPHSTTNLVASSLIIRCSALLAP